MRPLASINQFARKGIEKLEKEGIVLSLLDDYGIIVKFHELGEKVTGNFNPQALKVVTNPVIVLDELVFYHPSFGAYIKIHKEIVQWFSENSLLLNMATAYILVNSREPNKIHELVSPEVTEEKVLAWAKTLRVPYDDIRRVVEHIMYAPVEKEEKKEEKARLDIDFSDMEKAFMKMALMIVLDFTGRTLEELYWVIPNREVFLLVDKYLDDYCQREKERLAARGIVAPPSPLSAKMRAMKEFDAFYEKVREYKQNGPT